VSDDRVEGGRAPDLVGSGREPGERGGPLRRSVLRTPPTHLAAHAGRRAGTRHGPWAAVVVLVLVVGAERAGSSRESASLLRCVERAEAALAHGEARVAGAVQYASPLLTGAQTPPAVRQSLAEVVGDAAAGSLPGVDEARRGCATTAVLPWHDATRAALAAYEGLVDARRARLVAVTRSVRALYAPDGDVQRARASALAALRAGLAGTRERRAVELLSP
jgi:hypothetical protein